MINFAHIKRVAKYDKVNYYSVVLNNDKKSMFERFIDVHQKSNVNELTHIISWLKIIGEKYGALSHLFRNEGEIANTTALPPIGNRKPTFIKNGKESKNSLRLYCLRANEQVVFLFDGGLETTQKAQDCPNVMQHFKTANQITKALDEAFKQKNITWNDSFSDIIYQDEFKISF